MGERLPCGAHSRLKVEQHKEIELQEADKQVNNPGVATSLSVHMEESAKRRISPKAKPKIVPPIGVPIANFVGEANQAFNRPRPRVYFKSSGHKSTQHGQSILCKGSSSASIDERVTDSLKRNVNEMNESTTQNEANKKPCTDTDKVLRQLENSASVELRRIRHEQLVLALRILTGGLSGPLAQAENERILSDLLSYTTDLQIAIWIDELIRSGQMQGTISFSSVPASATSVDSHPSGAKATGQDEQ